ncbi:protein masquerade-like [Palaemon carinicauda]|uniref:protein masquerade-like n=1 Tax=Palaemon carinicauda TaxID=392227 RepID=UPI0035B67F5D
MNKGSVRDIVVEDQIEKHYKDGFGDSMLLVGIAQLTHSSPGKWSWGPIDVSSLPSNFPDSRLPHAPPTIPDEEEGDNDLKPESNSKLRSLCLDGNGVKCPLGISKGVSNRGLDIPSNGPPINVVQHHHFHTHAEKGGAVDARPIRQSGPTQGEQAFPHPILFGGQADFPAQAQNPLSPVGNPFSDIGQQLPQVNPSGQHNLPPGNPLLGQNPFPAQAQNPLSPGGNPFLDIGQQLPHVNPSGQHNLPPGNPLLGQNPFPAQAQNPLSPVGNPFLDIGQQLPQVNPSGQHHLPPGNPLLGQIPASSSGNLQGPFTEHPQPPSGPVASLPMVFPQVFPVEQRPLPQGSQFPLPIDPQLLPSNPHIPDVTQASSVPENQHPLLSPDIPPYREQCQCVHPTLCGPADVVPRLLPTDPLPHLLIDPRSLGTDVLSNATDLEANDKPSGGNESSNANTVSGESRLRRSTLNDTEAKTRNGRNHLLGVYYPGASGCQENHICCRELFLETFQNQFACGVRNAQGLLGRSAHIKLAKGDSEFGEHPWQAAILKDAHGESVYVCGAALITDRHALTAAHCVNSLHSSELKVRLGEWDVSGETEFLEHLDVPVAEIRSHPQYYAGNLNNDIALLTLQDLVDLSSNPHISPVCLPEASEIFSGQHCYSTGWGKDSFGSEGQFQRIMKEVEVPIVSHQQCQEALRGTRLGPGYLLHEGMLCAGGEAKRDACTGDGGGPLVCQGPDGTAHLAGLVSWGIGCGQLGVPGVYVNVPYYMDWILTYLKT